MPAAAAGRVDLPVARAARVPLRAWQVRRRIERLALLRDARSVAEAMRTILKAHPAGTEVDPDPAVGEVARRLGLDAWCLVLVGARVEAAHVTFVGVPSRPWHIPAVRSDLLRLKRRTAEAGARIVLVPHSSALREPLLANARAVASALDAPVAAADRAAVLALLRDRQATLAECAALPRGREAALRLVALGRVAAIGPAALEAAPLRAVARN